MTITLYYTPGSSPARTVLLAIKAFDLDVDLKELNLMQGEHLTPEFIKSTIIRVFSNEWQYLDEKINQVFDPADLKARFCILNPQHNVPTLDDNGFVLNESRAIISYLADKYGKDDSLYPKDPKKRAVVNQRLFFDMGTLYQRFGDLYYPVMFGGAPFDEEKKKKLDEALGFLDIYVGGTKFAAGDNVTIADLSLAASLSTIEAVGYDFSSYKNVSKYYNNCKSSLKGYQEANQVGADKFKGMYIALTQKK